MDRVLDDEEIAFAKSANVLPHEVSIPPNGNRAYVQSSFINKKSFAKNSSKDRLLREGPSPPGNGHKLH
ncbi:hypothetical protein GH714_001236 [Hevea brasiliensis]|uniref:Uncharacterized protein n=1 Tax=Hevea brasiliensis TaxID=3981 RepID=A0A6A6KFJ6_HEVBR|nr:hypothetical protein GH714_001236 [Hevea brasiliensis]